MSVTDSIKYTDIHYAGNVSYALLITDSSRVYIGDSEIQSSKNMGIFCDNSRLIFKGGSVNNSASSGIVLTNSDSRLYGIQVFNNDGVGISCLNGSAPEIGNCTISGNDNSGVFCFGDGTEPILLSSDAYPYCGWNDIFDNNLHGVHCSLYSRPYLGREDLPGQNEISDNLMYNVYDSSGNTIDAENNWWGNNPPDTTKFYGNVNYDPWLTSPPQDGQQLVHNPKQKTDETDPTGFQADEAYRLLDVGERLFLNGETYAAIDTFELVLEGWQNSSAARLALNHIVVAYRQIENYEGAVFFLDNYLAALQLPTWNDMALYHKALCLARLREYPAAIEIAGNVQVIQSWEPALCEPILIELGMMLKYGLDNVVSGDSVFAQFLLNYPESPLAPIAAVELGQVWQSHGTDSNAGFGCFSAASAPLRFTLYPAYPNPFNPDTFIRIGLPVASRVTLEVSDISGRVVGAKHSSNASPLLDWYPAGVHEIPFDGSHLSSGIYFAKLTSGDLTKVQKLVLLNNREE